MAASPSASGQLPPLSLDAIVNHFVASKRSLAAIEHVSRANAIVDNARLSLEWLATYAARSAYMHNAVRAQNMKLLAIRSSLQKVGDQGQAEFRTILASLDSADAAVKEILATLKDTGVEPSLRPDSANPQTLHSFVDENGIDELGAQFRSCIDQTNEAQDQLEDSNGALDDEMAAINDCIASVQDSFNTKGAAVIFKSLEEHASELASLMQSLVQHYDLCAQALKHTEGGGEAVEHVAQFDLPPGILPDLPDHLPSHQAISAEERAEMLHVLENDAAEVDDVVQEIRERTAEMELQGEQMAELLGVMRQRHQALAKATALMHQLGKRLPIYIDAGASFVHRWRELRSRIEGKLEEMHGLRQFYSGFLRAYDGLLVEIVRRKVVRSRMQKIAQDAMNKMQELRDDDAEEREAFKEEHGDFLPADIWPGLVQPPPTFDLKPVSDSDQSIPEIPKHAWQKATDRLRRSHL